MSDCLVEEGKAGRLLSLNSALWTADRSGDGASPLLAPRMKEEIVPSDLKCKMFLIIICGKTI